MSTLIHLETIVNAPIKVCFDLSRSIDLHQQTTKDTNEIAVAGKMSGLIELGEFVTWRATHFFIRQRLTSKITVCKRPAHFTDVMVDGAFKSFHHDHLFEIIGEQTRMIDNFNYEVPGGVFGSLFNYLILKRYMKRLLTKRNRIIKQVAETDDWKRYLK